MAVRINIDTEKQTLEIGPYFISFARLMGLLGQPPVDKLIREARTQGFVDGRRAGDATAKYFQGVAESALATRTPPSIILDKVFALRAASDDELQAEVNRRHNERFDRLYKLAFDRPVSPQRLVGVDLGHDDYVDAVVFACSPSPRIVSVSARLKASVL